MFGILKKKIITKKYKNGDTYVGEMKNDKRHGQGTMKFEDEDICEGEWKNDEQNGKAIYTWGPGQFHKDKYDGDWLDGDIHGYGTYIYNSQGGKYEGSWQKGSKHGKGIFTDDDGEKYEGEFKNNEKCGQGIQIWPDGEEYDGEWKDNKMHGHGIYTWPDGSKYDGAFEDGEQCGKGTFTSADGKVEEGVWEKEESKEKKDGFDFLRGIKKEKSTLGSILKGTLNITGEAIKTSYNVATSKGAIKFYKETAVLTKDVVVGAAGITKDVIDGAVDMINPSLKLKIIPHMEDTLLLGVDYDKVYKKMHDEVESGKSAEIVAEKFNKFKSHWLAIHTILLFDCIKNIKKEENLKEFNQLKKSDFDEIWDKVVLNTIKKRNPKAVQYIDEFYTNTFRVVDEEDVAKKLTVFLEECFDDDKVNKKNKNIILKSLKDTTIEYETSLIKLL